MVRSKVSPLTSVRKPVMASAPAPVPAPSSSSGKPGRNGGGNSDSTVSAPAAGSGDKPSDKESTPEVQAEEDDNYVEEE